MARKRYTFTEAKIVRFIHEGRGSGVGRDYKPWIKVSDVPSRGRTHRPYCAKTGRVHHLLSDNEYYAFLSHWWDDSVIDLREQFPLIDRRETMKIAAWCGVRHPVDPISQAIWVITTDLLVTVSTPHGNTLRAFAIKESADLENPRTLEKLEIERVFWISRDVPWLLMISDDLKNNFTRNLAWIFDPGPGTTGSVRARRIDEILTPYLLEAIYTEHELPIRLICLAIDNDRGYPLGTTLGCLRRLLASKHLRAPLDVPLLQDLPGSSFRIWNW
ncbi:TnsA endonuclease N-terminal domain-containing protein [Microvirga tunisiensis]|uniref:Heteromeric transposase endonuclease subunit TnsA n=1 Tax=Microvirga tunisiensis TaxID=2108360 RepID=A0A5N7MWY4_9HYPH|nr:TnsA endonuclease N-terminal domain-containing protein [Microvirga tunisiensis]MPR13615.1 heteromeric transposase endonuclease subunit TnsA [Microvirga tunisiensis]MPR31461.1 heteromeric transposase endonuclease subunit TnsA [Microvirga tunisiensis]